MIVVAEIRVNDREPEPVRHGNDAATAAAVLACETEVFVSSGAEAIRVLLDVGCRNQQAAFDDFVDYGVAKVYDWRETDRGLPPWRSVVIRLTPGRNASGTRDVIEAAEAELAVAQAQHDALRAQANEYNALADNALLPEARR